MQDKDSHNSHKDHPQPPEASDAARPGSEDFQRAENENPRANANIRDKQQEEQTTSDAVGSEITDGEDA